MGSVALCYRPLMPAVDAHAVVFEPHPVNFFRLTSTLAKLPLDVRKRVVAFPLGLSSAPSTAKIFSQKGNMGNSVVGKMTFDGVSEETVNEKMSRFTVVLRDLAWLFEKTLKASSPEHDFVVRVMKIDMQGYECELLKTFPEGLAARVVSGKMEVSRRQLPAQGCSVKRYMELLEKAGLRVVERLGVGGKNRRREKGEPVGREEPADDEIGGDYDIIVAGGAG